MPQRTFEPCIPTRGTKVPAGPDWIHEIKHDGYRLIVQREGKRVRLFTRNGHDWTDRYPLIVEAALRNQSSSPARPDGIFAAPFEQGEIGQDLFRKACDRAGGLVSKHRDRAYRAGTSPNWLKVKNPTHTLKAMESERLTTSQHHNLDLGEVTISERTKEPPQPEPLQRLFLCP
jgi:bifunctional non-homologous end joining protein LigD